MIRQCAGVCCGQESPETHRQRLLGALEHLRVSCWPYPGAIGLVERDAGAPEAAVPGDARSGVEPLVQIHVIRHWCYLGTVARVEDAAALDRVATDFDADGYKILCAPILSGSVELIPL